MVKYTECVSDRVSYRHTVVVVIVVVVVVAVVFVVVVIKSFTAAGGLFQIERERNREKDTTVLKLLPVWWGLVQTWAEHDGVGTLFR